MSHHSEKTEAQPTDAVLDLLNYSYPNNYPCVLLPKSSKARTDRPRLSVYVMVDVKHLHVWTERVALEASVRFR